MLSPVQHMLQQLFLRSMCPFEQRVQLVRHAGIAREPAGSKKPKGLQMIVHDGCEAKVGSNGNSREELNEKDESKQGWGSMAERSV